MVERLVVPIMSSSALTEGAVASVVEETVQPRALIPELYPTIEQQHVHLVAQGARRVADIARALETPGAHPGNLFLTNVALVEKTADAINPEDVLFAGGTVPDNAKKSLAAREADARHLARERQLNTVVAPQYPQTLPTTQPADQLRSYAYLYPGKGYIYRDDHVFYENFSPFTSGRMGSYVPREKVIPLEVNPAQFRSLLENNSMLVSTGSGEDGEAVRERHLVDSLVTGAQQQEVRGRGVVYSGKEANMKNTWLNQIYHYEVQTRHEVVTRLLEKTTHPDKDQLSASWQSIISYYQTRPDAAGASGVFDAYAAWMESFLADDRAERTAEFLRAVHRENFIKDTIAIEKASTQAPFLLSHLLCEAPEITDFEEQQIRRFPTVNELVSLACRITGVRKEDNPAWYTQMQEALQQQAEADPALLNSQLVEQFCGSFEIEPATFGDKLAAVYEFETYFQEAIDHIQDAETRAWMSQQWQAPPQESLQALYSGMLSDTDDTIRQASWRRLILLSMQPLVERVIAEKKRKEYGLDPYGKILTNMKDQNPDEMTIGKHQFEVYTMPPQSSQLAYGTDGQSLDMSAYVSRYFIRERKEKKPASILRKLLERNGENGKGWFDFRGMQCVLDQEGFLAYIKDTRPELLSDPQLPDVITAWKQAMTQQLLDHFRKSLHEDGLKVSWSNVRATGDMKGMLPEDDFEGSAASNVDWEWLKTAVIAEVDPQEHQDTDHTRLTPEQQQDGEWTFELQIFPNTQAQILKSHDDELIYAAARLFRVHKKDRFSMFEVLVWYADMRQQLMKNAAKNGLLR